MSTSQQNTHWHYTGLDDRNFQIHGRTLFYVITLFFITVILILIFLYARWIYNFHRISARTPIPPPLPVRMPKPQGLDPGMINALPITLHAGGACKECCICLGEFEDGDKVKSLPQCEHFFHCDCVDKWLSSHSSCPLCRVSVRVGSDTLIANCNAVN